MLFHFETEYLRAIYFIGNDIFMITFFVILTKVLSGKHLKGLIYACLFFSIGMLLDNILLFFGLGDVSKWYYEFNLLILTMLGYLYGATINKFKLTSVRNLLADMFDHVTNK